MVDTPNQSADLKAGWDAAFGQHSHSPRLSATDVSTITASRTQERPATAVAAAN